MKDGEATYIRAVVRSEIKFEPRWSTSLGWSFRTHVQAIRANIFHSIQVLHRPLTLLLHGCEPVQLVTLRYCCLQENKTDSVL